MPEKVSLRQTRIFSEDLRRHIVNQIESGELTPAAARREYGIKASRTIYLWLDRYSRNLKKGTRLVMEKDSQSKSNEELRKKVLELEAALGRKALEADLYRFIVEKASKIYKVDLKKNFGEKESGPSK